MDPKRRCVVIVGGFNYGENAEVEDPLVPGGGRRAASHPRGRAWAHSLSTATEMIPHKPTHWAPRLADRHLDRQDMDWFPTLVTHADLSAWAGAWRAPRDAPRRALGPRDVL
eukprot:2958192-Pyramimonas_sp.AAC.1